MLRLRYAYATEAGKLAAKAADFNTSPQISYLFELRVPTIIRSFNLPIGFLLIVISTLWFVILDNLNVIFSFCREINGEKKNFCLVTNPRKKLKYRMFTEAES